MQKKIDLINGPILSSLTRLAIPIMATSLIQMAYNLIDMIWIGRLGSLAVASVGAAGMYMWLASGLVTLTRMGGQVHVGHAIGAGNTDSAGRYASVTFQMTILLGILYGLLCTLASSPLIAFFHLNSAAVANDAVTSFIAQNHGAGKEDRIHTGYRCALKIVLPWGLFCTILLLCFPAPIFKIFITEPDVIPMGVSYLMILGISQLFTSLEITTSGAFCGYGKTLPPSITGITLNLLRIPMALLLTTTPLALNGIWWSISISSILKGVILFIWFQITFRKCYNK